MTDADIEAIYKEQTKTINLTKLLNKLSVHEIAILDLIRERKISYIDGMARINELHRIMELINECT